MTCLLFLCEKDKEADKEFKTLVLLYGLVEKAGNIVIERKTLYEILIIYFNIVSYLSVDFLKSAISEDEYVKTRYEAFSEAIQDDFITTMLNYSIIPNITSSNNSNSETIEVTPFFNKNYDFLSNNEKIRVSLYNLWKSKN